MFSSRFFLNRNTIILYVSIVMIQPSACPHLARPNATDRMELPYGADNFMINPFVILIGTLLIVALFAVFLLTIFIQATRRRVDQRIRTTLTDAPKRLETPSARFLGFLSGTGEQLKGSGSLVLTDNQLLFFQALPPHNLTLPLAAVREATTVSTYQKKNYSRPILKVTFSTHHGQDAAAWVIPDPEPWISALTAEEPIS